MAQITLSHHLVYPGLVSLKILIVADTHIVQSIYGLAHALPPYFGEALTDAPERGISFSTVKEIAACYTEQMIRTRSHECYKVSL